MVEKEHYILKFVPKLLHKNMIDTNWLVITSVNKYFDLFLLKYTSSI